MAGPGDEMAAAGGRGDGRLRASRADREHVIELLKTAFVQDRLTKDELDARVGQALASRTYAELAAVIGDLHAWPAAAGPTAAEPASAGPTVGRPPSTPARTLAKAGLRSGMCILTAFAIAGIVALTSAQDSAIFLAFLSAVVAVIAASGFLGYGVVDAWQQHRSHRQLPPRPGRGDGGGLEGGRPSGTGRDPAPPGARPDQTRVDLRAHRPGQDRRPPSGRGSRTPPGTRLIPGAI
jgi:hypothetical protein